MNKTINPLSAIFPGTYGNQKIRAQVYIKIELKAKDGDKKTLSISGVEGPTWGGDCLGGAGQIRKPLSEYQEPAFSPAWDSEKYTKLCDVWRKWHLNDMLAGCEHQDTWDTSKKIVDPQYTWSKDYYHRLKQAERGQLTVGEYADYRKDAQLMQKTLGFNAKEKDIAEAFDRGILVMDKKKTTIQPAGNVSFERNEEGLLGKKCTACGNEYGSSWLYRPIPSDVLNFLAELPETTQEPAWI